MWEFKYDGLIRQLYDAWTSIGRMEYGAKTHRYDLPHDGCSVFWGTLARVLGLVFLIPLVSLTLIGMVSVPAEFFGFGPNLHASIFGWLDGINDYAKVVMFAYLAISFLAPLGIYILAAAGIAAYMFYLLSEYGIPSVRKALFRNKPMEAATSVVVTPLNMLFEFFKARKEKYCPRVVWKEETDE